MQHLQCGAQMQGLVVLAVSVSESLSRISTQCFLIHLLWFPVQSSSLCGIKVWKCILQSIAGPGRKIASYLNKISKHFKRMIILRQRSPLVANYSLFLTVVYSALKCIIMSSNQGQILLFCSVRSWGRKWTLCPSILQFEPIIRKIMIYHPDR